MKEFDETLLEAGRLFRDGKESLLENVGKLIAALTIAIAAIVTFTDVRFAGWDADFSCRIAVFWLAAVVMFFSLEREGESLGRQTADTRAAKETLGTLCGQIHGTSLPALHAFCRRYAAEECAFRHSALLLAAGKSEDAYASFLRGEKTSRKDRRLFRRVRREKPYPLTPQDLLGGERSGAKSELANPESSRFSRLLASLIPSLACMTVTVSVVVRLKSGLSAEIITEGVLKLFTLLTVGFRGYLQGFRYVTESLTPWLCTKGKLLEAFLAEETR